MCKKKKKTAASTVAFRFVATDAIVIENLSATEIQGVTQWQHSETYVFEFHEGHDTGYPIYIRPVQGLSKTETNIPKVNTKNGAAPTTIGGIVNGNKLSNCLGGTDQTELLNIIRTEWNTLVILARRYWEGEIPPVAQQVRPSRTCTKCGYKAAGEVDLGAPDEFGKLRCPKCKKGEMRTA